MFTMRCVRVAVAVGLMAAWPSVGTGQESTPVRAGQGTIAGRVVVRGTDHPVAGALVTLSGPAARATSDEAGTFVFAAVPPGPCTVAAEADGYKAASVGVVVEAGVTARVTIALDADPLRIEERVDVRGRLPRGSEAQPGTAFTLTGTRVTTISGTLGDFGRTLRSVPSASGTSDERSSVVARGGNPVENGFYIDNIEVPNVSHLPDWGSTGGFYSLIDPFMVDAFDFVVGGFPARFGGHLSSVTDMTYRVGSRDRIRGQARFDIAMAAIGAEGPLPGKRGTWRASVRHADFIYLKEIISLDDANPRWTDAHLHVAYDLSPRHRVSLLDVFSSDRLLEHQESNLDERTEIDQNTVGLNWRATWSDGLRSETSVSCSRFERLLGLEYRPPDDRYNWAIARKTTWAAIRNENTWSTGARGQLRFGAQARWYEHDVEYLVVPARPGTILVSTGPWAYRTTDTAAFVSGDVRPHPRLGLTAGIRAEHASASGRSHVTPRAAVSFRVTESVQLNGTAAVVHQPLPADLMALTPGALALRDMGARQYSAGVSVAAPGGWRATIDAYDKSSTALPLDPSAGHRLVLDREPFRDYNIPLRLVDTGTGRARGVEALIERRLGQGFSGVIAARASRNTYRDASGVERHRLFESRYGVTVAADWTHGDAWNVSGAFVLQDGTPYTPTHEEASAALGMWVRRGGQYNTLRYPVYASLNVRVERRFQAGRTILAAYADCWNLLGRQNVGWIEGWNAETGDVFQYQMPRTPFVGVGVIF